MSDIYTDCVSSETLEAIRYNECEARPSLVTSRFRRLWNELAAANEAGNSLRDVLRRNGFVPCDISACNCGSWHHRYGLPERFEELKQSLSDAGHPVCNENGNLPSRALQALIQERDALRAEVERLQARIDGLMLEYCPGDMTDEQIANYWRNQRPATEQETTAIDAARKPEPRMWYSKKDDPTNWNTDLGVSDACEENLLPDGPVCPRCGGPRAPSGIDGGSWVHFPSKGRRRRGEEGVSMSKETKLPDGSAFSVLSFPLPETHWLYAPRGKWDNERDEYAECPRPILTGAQRDAVVAAARYAIRGATMCGKESDFDPDALVQNICYALCGPCGTLAAVVSDNTDTGE